jgi:hypothetical protein
LKASNKLSLNLTAGSVRLGVGKPGVERVMLTEDSSVSRGETVRVKVPTTLRCRSIYVMPNEGSIAD